MLEKVWNYIKSTLSNNEQQEKVSAVPFQIGSKKSKPYSQPLPRIIFGIKQVQTKTSQYASQSFRLIIDEEIKLPGQQEQVQKTVQEHISIIQEVKELSSNLKRLNLIDQRRRREELNIAQLQKQITFKRPFQQSTKKQTESFRSDYKREIEDFLALKYSKQKSQYALITLQQFSQIHQFWKNKRRTNTDVKNTNFECVKKLSFRSLGCLDYCQWLNDDIINIYLEMLEKSLLQNFNSPYKLLNTYFATNILGKTETQIQRFLKKKNLNKDDTLIMPINNKNHWYFAVFEQDQIVIYDSIKRKQYYYSDNPIFKNAIKFSKTFYGKDFRISIGKEYPQQNNNYDCGVFMLLGVRDLLRSKQWSYHQGDIRFKRVQIASEILKEKLIFNQ